MRARLQIYIHVDVCIQKLYTYYIIYIYAHTTHIYNIYPHRADNLETEKTRVLSDWELEGGPPFFTLLHSFSIFLFLVIHQSPPAEGVSFFFYYFSSFSSVFALFHFCLSASRFLIFIRSLLQSQYKIFSVAITVLQNKEKKILEKHHKMILDFPRVNITRRRKKSHFIPLS